MAIISTVIAKTANNPQVDVAKCGDCMELYQLDSRTNQYDRIAITPQTWKEIVIILSSFREYIILQEKGKPKSFRKRLSVWLLRFFTFFKRNKLVPRGHHYIFGCDIAELSERVK